MQKTIVRAYKIEVTDEDIVRMRSFWRNCQREALNANSYLNDHGDKLSEQEVGEYTLVVQKLIDLTDNGCRSFNEWLFQAYEAASHTIDGGDHSGVLYYSFDPAVGGWAESELLDRDKDGELIYDFGPITYIFHGHDLEAEGAGEDDFFDDLGDEDEEQPSSAVMA